MTQTANDSFRPFMGDTVRAAIGVMARILVGMLLVLIAGVVALMTAIAGIMLAAVAIAMRFAGSRPVRKQRFSAEGGEGITLEARRTPRGWTVE